MATADHLAGVRFAAGLSDLGGHVVERRLVRAALLLRHPVLMGFGSFRLYGRGVLGSGLRLTTSIASPSWAMPVTRLIAAANHQRGTIVRRLKPGDSIDQ